MAKKLMNLRLEEELIERSKVAAKDAGESLTQYVAVALSLRLDPPSIHPYGTEETVSERPIPPYVRGPGISRASNVPPPEPKAPKEVAAPIIAEAKAALAHIQPCPCLMCAE